MGQSTTSAPPKPSPFSLHAFMMGDWHYPLQVNPLLLSTPFLSPGAKLLYSVLVQFHYPTRNEAIDHPEVLCEILGCTPGQARQWFNELKRSRLDHNRPPLALRKQAFDPEDEDRGPAPRLHFVDLDNPPQPAPCPASPEGCIYVLRAGDTYKIGKARKYGSRLAQHRSSSPHELAEVMCEQVRDYHKVEHDLHKRFAHKQVRLEWFRLDDDDLAEIREALADARA